jgi:hypothetical protein
MIKIFSSKLYTQLILNVFFSIKNWYNLVIDVTEYHGLTTVFRKNHC